MHEHGAEVGCLLLADHPHLDHLELVYMGITPQARGKGYGAELLTQAVLRADLLGAARLVLAVDERNTYARRVYEQRGFTAWDRRTVYARLA